MKKIHFLPRHMAEAVLPPPNCGVISISTPFDTPAALKSGWEAVLRISFFDADDVKGAGAVPGTVFDAQKAGEVLQFVEAHKELDELVVHCDLGVSRSAAIAIFLGEFLQVPVFRRGAPVDPRYGQHNRLVYRQLHDAAYGTSPEDVVSVFSQQTN